jgi:hypothetical protein
MPPRKSDDRHNNSLARAVLSCTPSATTKTNVNVSRVILQQHLREAASIQESNLFNMLHHENLNFAPVSKVEDANPYTERRHLTSNDVSVYHRAIDIIIGGSSLKPILIGSTYSDFSKHAARRTRYCILWCKAILQEQTSRPRLQSALRISNYCMKTGRNRDYLYCFLWQCFLQEDCYTVYDACKSEAVCLVVISACELLFDTTDISAKIPWSQKVATWSCARRCLRG